MRQEGSEVVKFTHSLPKPIIYHWNQKGWLGGGGLGSLHTNQTKPSAFLSMKSEPKKEMKQIVSAYLKWLPNISLGQKCINHKWRNHWQRVRLLSTSARISNNQQMLFLSGKRYLSVPFADTNLSASFSSKKAELSRFTSSRFWNEKVVSKTLLNKNFLKVCHL